TLAQYALFPRLGSRQVLALAPGGRLVVSEASGDKISVLDLATGKVGFSARVAKNTAHRFAFTPDCKSVVFVDTDHGKNTWIRIWDLSRNQDVSPLLKHAAVVTRLAISSDGKRVAHCLRDPLVLVWDVATGKELHRLEQGEIEAQALAFSSDGTLLAAVDSGQMIYLWDLQSGKRRGQFGERYLDQWPGCLSFSQDGRSIASVGSNNGVRVWEVS